MKKKLLIISLSFLLASCVNHPTGSLPPSSSEEPVSYRETFDNVLDAVGYLKEQKNYTLDVRLLKDGILMDEFDVSYTKDGYYFGVTDGEYGYKAVEDGVFAYEIYGSDMYFSALLEENGEKLTTIWGNDLIPSFADWSLDKLADLPANGGVIKAKDSRVAMMAMTGFGDSYYPYLETASAYINDDGSFYFTYSMDVDSYDYTIKATVLMVGGTATEKVDKALKDGKTYYTLTPAQKKAKELFEGDNYTHVYQDDAGEDVAWEKFTPDYYSISVDGNYNSSHPDAPLIPASYVKIDNKYVPAAKAVLRGVYHCTINGGTAYLMVGPNGEGYNSVPDMVSFLHYPKTMHLWDCFEYSTKNETALDGFDETYTFNRVDLAENAADNFGLSAVLEANGTTAVSVSMSVKNIDKASAKVSFRIVAANGKYDDFLFTDFGTTSEPVLDNLIATFQDPEAVGA